MGPRINLTWLFLAICLLGTTQGLIREQDLTCTDRNLPFTKVLGEGTTVVSKLNSVALLSKTQKIFLCADYDYVSTNGVIAGMDIEGSLEWAYALHMPCVHIYVDDKESSVYSVLFTPGSNLEVHSYNSNDTLDRNYMYELKDSDIAGVHDATINGDFNWILVTKNDNSCYIIMITKIRRKTYMCTENVAFKGIRFVNSDPLLVGHDNTGLLHFALLYSDRFEVKWQKRLTQTTPSSSDVSLYDPNDSTDTSNGLAAFSTSAESYPLVVSFSHADGTISKNRYLKYSITSVKINYSSTQKDFILSGEISSTSQIVFVRFSANLEFGDLRVIKANNQLTYKVIPETIIVDTNANIIMGGTANENLTMIYMTGEELSSYSCVMKDSERININTIESSFYDLTLEDSNIILNNDAANALWDNKTGRVFGYDSTIIANVSCTSPLNSHWIKPRYVPSSYAMRFSSICDGTKNQIVDINELNLTLEATKHSSGKVMSNPKLEVHNGKIEMATTTLKATEYHYSLKILPENSTTGEYVEMVIEYEVERSLLMIFLTVVYFLIFLFFLLDAVYHNKFKLLKYFIFSAQFIHLTGLMDVTSPPASLYFVSNTSIFSFTNVYLTRTMMEYSIETEDSYMFNGGFETKYTTLMLPSSLVMIAFLIICMAIVYMCYHCRIVTMPDENRREFMTKFWKVYIKESFYTIWQFMFPFYLLMPLYEYVNYEGGQGMASISIIFSSIALLINLVLMLVFQIASLWRLCDKYVDKETSKSVKENFFFVVRRIFVIVLLLVQNSFNAFEAAFAMFTINAVFTCINTKHMQTKMDLVYYCIMEIAELVFGFLTITYTSYNLDIRNKQTVALVGIIVILFVYMFAVSIRIHEAIKEYKVRKQERKEMIRSTTQNDMIRNPYGNDDKSGQNDEILDPLEEPQAIHRDGDGSDISEKFARAPRNRGLDETAEIKDGPDRSRSQNLNFEEEKSAFGRRQNKIFEHAEEYKF